MNIYNKVFSVRASYIVIFLSLVIWAFFAFYTMNQLISSQKVYSKLINVSGKQRMLSQKTTLIAKRVLETKDVFLFAHLKELAKKMKEDHLFLINNLTSEHMSKIYFKEPFQVKIEVERYLKLLDEFFEIQNEINVAKIEQFSFKLLPSLDYAVNEFEKESDKNTSKLQKRELFILIGTLITLLLEVIFVMIPALKIVKDSKQKLVDFNNELQKEVKKKTLRLEQEHEKKKFYLNTINSIVVNLDIDGNIIMINQKGLSILGFKEEELLGKSWFEIGVLPTDDINRSKTYFNHLINEDIDIKEKIFENILIDRDGNEKNFTWSRSIIKEHGKVIGVLSSGIDVTNEKKQEHIIKEQTKLASMGEMIGNIAHQWRQPLSVISTAATGMRIQSELDILEQEHLLDMCDKINENAQYLSQTIDDFRNFIKGDSKPVSFNLHNDTDSFIKLVDTTIKKYNIQVFLDLEEGININGFPNELIQCFINIFNNSKDAILEKHIDKTQRFIFISQHIHEDKVEIIFKDNAGGVPEKIIDKIFDPYFTTKDSTNGTGLGLHMTQSLIVNGMGGHIYVENETYKFNDKEYFGAKFVIELPLDSKRI